MFQFDEWGYITPPEVHILTLADFERIFVFDAERERLFRRLLSFVAELKDLGTADFYIWLDGSFVTKKRAPRDIDVVVFFESNEIGIAFKYLRLIREAYEFDLDIFFATPQNQVKWKEFFTSDRGGRLKGLIQINFHNVSS